MDAFFRLALEAASKMNVQQAHRKVYHLPKTPSPVIRQLDGKDVPHNMKICYITMWCLFQVYQKVLNYISLHFHVMSQ